MNYSRLIKLALIGLFISSCSSERREMSEGEKFLADKLGAEWTSIGLTQSESQTNGKTTERRKFIDIIVMNSRDIEKIFEDKEYFEKSSKNVAQLVLDSLKFGEISFRPEEIQLEFVEESGFLIFNSERKRSTSYNLNE